MPEEDLERMLTQPSTETHSFTAYGVDGCRAGWFFVALKPCGEIYSGIIKTFEELVKTTGKSDRIFVDIPIGLPDDSDERECDLDARRILGPPRASSVFRVPVRAALQADTYEKVKQINQEATGKKISRQSFEILPKIKEVDSLLRLNPRARNIIREVHPEICFWALSGQTPMVTNKKKDEGFRERIAVLKSVRPSVEEEVKQIMNRFKRKKSVAKDDILDAFVAAITASAKLVSLQTIPAHPKTDCFGLPMEMVYVPLEYATLNDQLNSVF